MDGTSCHVAHSFTSSFEFLWASHLNSSGRDSLPLSTSICRHLDPSTIAGCMHRYFFAGAIQLPSVIFIFPCSVAFATIHQTNSSIQDPNVHRINRFQSANLEKKFFFQRNGIVRVTLHYRITLQFYISFSLTDSCGSYGQNRAHD